MKRIVAIMLAFCMCVICGMSFADDPYSMICYTGSTGSQDLSSNTFFTDREEETGISFLFEQFDDYTKWKDEIYNLLSDNDSSVDVLFKANLTSSEIQQLYSQGMIIDLKPYLAEYAPNLTKLLVEHPEWERAITLPDGSIPALPSINEVQNNNSMWVNKKWLDNLKMSAPTTKEEFVEVLRAFKTKDPNSNGKKDEIPLSFVSMWDLKFLTHMFGFVMNDYGICTDNDGKVEYLVTSQQNREFISWLHELWNEGLLWEEGFSSPDTLRIVTDSKATQTYGMFFAASPMSIVPTDWSDDYEMLMPMQCDGKQVYRQLQSEVQIGAFALTSHCKEPEKLVQWVDYLYGSEGSQRAQSGKLGVDYTFDSEGKWTWTEDPSTVVSEVIPLHTISNGGDIPAYIDADFQQKYDDEQTNAAIEGILKLQESEYSPYPQVYFTAEERSRVKEIQNDAGAYAEQQMVWFVTGEKEITDETWQEFASKLQEKNIAEVVQIFQQAYDRQYR